MQPQRRNRGLEYGVILLIMELFNVGVTNIPPVTLLSILGQLALYAGFVNVPWDKWDVCLNARDIIKGKEYRRLFLSAVEHGDDMHLYYNMLSFLIKGRSLERRMGSKNFFLTLAVLTVLTSCYYVGMGWALTHFTNDPYYMKVCAVGFSGVIFALKVLTSEHQEAGMKYAVWSELILIYLLVPGSSFMGHLAGILAGLTFVKTRIGKFLKKVIEGVTGRPIEQQANQGAAAGQGGFFNNNFGGFGNFGFRRQQPTYGFRPYANQRQPRVVENSAFSSANLAIEISVRGLFLRIRHVGPLFFEAAKHTLFLPSAGWRPLLLRPRRRERTSLDGGERRAALAARGRKEN